MQIAVGERRRRIEECLLGEKQNPEIQSERGNEGAGGEVQHLFVILNQLLSIS